jgi:hypothetical protein
MDMTTKCVNTVAAAMALVAGTCVSAPAWAVIKNWAGPVSGNASVGGNWFPAGVPLITDDWWISPAGTYTVTLNGAAPDASAEFAVIANGTITINNQGATHVTSLLRAGDNAPNQATAIFTGNAFQAAGVFVASLVPNINGVITLDGADLTMEDNGLIRIADNTNCTGILRLRSGALLTDLTNPPGVDTDTGEIRVGASGSIIVNDAQITLPEWDLNLSAGGDLTVSNNAIVDIDEMSLGATSVVGGAGIIKCTQFASVTGAMIENTGVLVIDALGLTSTPTTLRVNPGSLTFTDVSGLVNGAFSAGTIQMNGGTLQVEGVAAGVTEEILNSSLGSIVGVGIIDANIVNEGIMQPSGVGFVIGGELFNDTGTINGTALAFPAAGSFRGKGNVNAGVNFGPGSLITLTGDTQFGTFGAGAAAGVTFQSEARINGHAAFFRDAGVIDLDGITRLGGGSLRVQNGAVVTATAELHGPGALMGDYVSSGLLNTDGLVVVSMGSLQLNAPADTRLVMRGKAFGDFGTVRVVAPGTATINGSLEIVLRDSFDYVTGDEFVLIDAPAGRAGTFGAVTYTNARNGAIFNLLYNATSVRLRVLRGGCDSIDFNNNSVFPEDQDVIDFFDVLAGGSPATCDPVLGCGSIDFNNNGVFPEDEDVIDFFKVLAGGTCS